MLSRLDVVKGELKKGENYVLEMMEGCGLGDEISFSFVLSRPGQESRKRAADEQTFAYRASWMSGNLSPPGAGGS